jgi:hypothetical protein
LLQNSETLLDRANACGFAHSARCTCNVVGVICTLSRDVPSVSGRIEHASLETVPFISIELPILLMMLSSEADERTLGGLDVRNKTR